MKVLDQGRHLVCGLTHRRAIKEETKAIQTMIRFIIRKNTHVISHSSDDDLLIKFKTIKVNLRQLIPYKNASKVSEVPLSMSEEFILIA